MFNFGIATALLWLCQFALQSASSITHSSSFSHLHRLVCTSCNTLRLSHSTYSEFSTCSQFAATERFVHFTSSHHSRRRLTDQHGLRILHSHLLQSAVTESLRILHSHLLQFAATESLHLLQSLACFKSAVTQSLHPLLPLPSTSSRILQRASSKEIVPQLSC
ncbi:unnamed protein product [Penicillium salamii]|nr:unnamed protein product [Penicillium salamii]